MARVKRKLKRRSPYAMAVTRLKPKIVPSKKKYKRKPRHRKLHE